MAQPPNTDLTREARVRFWLRMVILLIYPAFSSISFGQIMSVLLLMSTVLSVVLATLKREQPLAPVINHWDEAIAYAALCCLIVAFNHNVAA